MSVIQLSKIKAMLQVIHDLDDERIQLALDSAEVEACDIMNRKYLPTIDDPAPPDPESETYSETDPISENETVSGASDEVRKPVFTAVYILTKAIFDNENISTARQRAETLLSPYRKGLGV